MLCFINHNSKIPSGDVALQLVEEIIRISGSFLLEEISTRQINPVVYTLVRLGELNRAIMLVEDLRACGISPDIATHNSILKGLALLKNPTDAVLYYNDIVQKVENPSPPLTNSVLPSDLLRA